jgi:hypothetical protein
VKDGHWMAVSKVLCQAYMLGTEAQFLIRVSGVSIMCPHLF